MAKPNVVLIVSDDQGYNDMPALGTTDALTPQLDALAAGGILFTDFYVQPVCTPTRFCLLTGLHIGRASHTKLHKALLWGDVNQGLGADKTVIADLFKRNGYQTALIGKWHLGHGLMTAEPPQSGAADSEFHPNNHGFDFFYGFLSGAIDFNTHWNQDRWQDWFEMKNFIPGGEDGLYATHAFTNRAVQYINEHKDEPFFLYLAHNAVHSGNIPTPRTAIEQNQLPVGEDVDRIYLSRFDSLWPPSQDQTSVRKRHLAMLAVMDDGIGEVMDALRANGIEENTLVVFTSDNGGRNSFGGWNDPLRSQKGHVYEGGIRVPALMYWKGVIGAGQTSAQVASATDMPRTIGQLVGLNMTSYRTDGLDLSSHILGGPVIERDLFIHSDRFGEVLRRGKWKYVQDKRSTAAHELYDLEADIGETTNLAATRPDVLAELMAAHAERVAALNDPPNNPYSSRAANWSVYR